MVLREIISNTINIGIFLKKNAQTVIRYVTVIWGFLLNLHNNDSMSILKKFF